MHQIPAPAIRDLLPPLLACLPTAFVSPQPPPALLPLLSPILRQRMHLLATGPAGHAVDPRSPSSTWLGLLTWQEDRAERLNELVATLQLEPHPVSGELELFDEAAEAHKPDAARISYRRLDPETLQARCELALYGLAVHWVWVESDSGAVGAEALLAGPSAAQNTGQDAWKVAEVLPVEDDDGRGNTRRWCASIAQADERNHGFSIPSELQRDASRDASAPAQAPAADDDDDDYWNSYDRTPGASTPAAKPTPGSRGALFGMTPVHPERSASSAAARARAEREYFSRYGDVQPAMDNFDPDEAAETPSSKPQGFGPGADRARDGRPVEAKAIRPGWQEIAREREAADLVLERGRPRSRNGEGFLDGAAGAAGLAGVAGGAGGMGMAGSAGAAGAAGGAALSASEVLHVEAPPNLNEVELSRQTTVTQDFADALAARSAREDRDKDKDRERERQEEQWTERRRSSVVPPPVEACIKQHISYELKSLWRLGRGIGLETDEFKSIIRRELDVLELLEE